MTSQTQISAYVAASTKRELDAYAEAHGLKQGFLVEEALRHHLRALRELPDDVTLCLKDHNQPESASRPDPAYFVSSLLPSHGEEWHSHFATRVNDRYVVAPEILDSICKDSIQKANDLAKLF
jgi:hypothetical protein